VLCRTGGFGFGAIALRLECGKALLQLGDLRVSRFSAGRLAGELLRRRVAFLGCRMRPLELGLEARYALLQLADKFRHGIPVGACAIAIGAQLRLLCASCPFNSRRSDRSCSVLAVCSARDSSACASLRVDVRAQRAA
jgi:hypothetical protein